MTIDADCHLSSAKHDELAMTEKELLETMDKAEIERALIWLKPTYSKEIARENKAVFEASQHHPDRFLAFGWANPRLGEKETYETLERCLNDYNFLGIKFNGAQDDYVIDAPSVLPFIAQIAEAGKVIAFHIGADFFENTHPYRLGNIAQQFPETKFIMIHMGGAAIPTLARAAIETAQKHKNIHIIASAIPDRAIVQALDSLGTERISFGSDSPFRLMHVQLAKFKALLQNYSNEERELVLGKNILRVLNKG